VFEIIFKNEFEFFKKIPYILIKKILEIQGYFYKITLADSQNKKKPPPPPPQVMN
jgi:hypothetical protein